MIQINTIFLNKHLQKNIKDSIKSLAVKNEIDYELALLRGDENEIYSQIKDPKRTLKFLLWEDLTGFYKKQKDKDSESSYRAVYTFYIKNDDFDVANALEKSLMDIGLYETIERPLPNIYYCTTCHWEGKYYELTSIDLGFSDIEDNVCPSCESNQIKNLKIKKH